VFLDEGDINPEENKPTPNNKEEVAAVAVLRKQSQDCVNIRYDPQT